MNSTKISISNSTFISKTDPLKNFSNNPHIVIGQYSNDCFRGILDIKLPEIAFTRHVCSAELTFFVNEFKIAKNIETFMLNIGRNLETFDIKSVTWQTTPKFFQEAHMCRINESCLNNYIIIDIKNILDYYIKNKIEDISLTLLGLSDLSIISIGSNLSHKKCFLKLKFSNSPNKNPTTNTSTIKKNKLTASITTDVDEFNFSSNLYNQFNSTENLNQTLEFKKENSSIENKKKQTAHANNINEQINSFGNFISATGTIIGINSNKYVKFDSSNNNINCNLTAYNDGISILYKGYYNIEYRINCICETVSLVELELNGKVIPDTKAQIGFSNIPYSSNTIINVTEDNMSLRFKINSNSFLLFTDDVAVHVTIIKIG